MINKAVVVSDDYPVLLRARRRRERWSAEDRRLYQRHRWRSEGFHGEAKTWHGLARAVRRGLANMKIQAYTGCAIERLCRQGLSRPRHRPSAPRLYLRPEARRLRPHQTRAASSLRHRRRDRAHEDGWPSRPLLSQRPRGRCRQRHPLRCRLQLPPRPRLAEDSLDPNPAHSLADVSRPTCAYEGFLTGD
jgi:hypothetical protein